MSSSLAAALLVIPAVAALLWARWHEDLRAVAGAKAAASGLLVLAACLSEAADARYGAWIRAGLVASLAGDLFLTGSAKRWVAAGLGAFFLAHLCYLVAVWPLAPAAAALGPLRLVAISVPLLVVGGAGLRAAWPRLGRLRGPVLAYFAVLAAMTALALAAWWANPAASGRALLGLGMALFFVSDLAVARQRFVASSFRNKLWGLPTYYGGQALLALSVAHVELSS